MLKLLQRQGVIQGKEIVELKTDLQAERQRVCEECREHRFTIENISEVMKSGGESLQPYLNLVWFLGKEKNRSQTRYRARRDQEAQAIAGQPPKRGRVEEERKGEALSEGV